MKLSRWLLAGGVVGAAGAAGYWLARYLQPESSPLILNGCVVLVTGASSGIGAALADAFARRGAKLVLAARRAQMLEGIRQQIEPYAADVLAIPTDITRDADLQALVRQTLAHFGRIDILVNNAGVLVSGPLHTLSPEEISQGMRTNLEAAITLTGLVLPTMLAQRSGKIINIASTSGRVVIPGAIPYVVPKQGLMAFSEALRRETFGTGVSVTAVLPYWTRTDMVPPALQSRLAYLDTPEFVAEHIIDGVLKQHHTILFGDAQVRVGMWLERHLPLLMRLYWQARVTPNFLASLRQIRRG
jgi:short-subunit dehydrogenase